LRLGLAASAAALVGHGTARAADTLVIDSTEVANFAGKRNNFSDVENAGNLRVGAAWGIPGIYSEKGPVVIGSQDGNIWLNGKVGIGARQEGSLSNPGGCRNRHGRGLFRQSRQPYAKPYG
jgi:hypothetical protein